MERKYNVGVGEELSKYSNKKVSNRTKVIRYLKFFLIPGWRDPEFGSKEYEIDKIKSKRRLFRRLITPLTIMGFFLILLILYQK